MFPTKPPLVGCRLAMVFWNRVREMLPYYLLVMREQFKTLFLILKIVGWITCSWFISNQVANILWHLTFTTLNLLHTWWEYCVAYSLLMYVYGYFMFFLRFEYDPCLQFIDQSWPNYAKQLSIILCCMDVLKQLYILTAKMTYISYGYFMCSFRFEFIPCLQFIDQS